MARIPLYLLLALLGVACGSSTSTDGGSPADSGATPDSGAPADSGSPPDAGPMGGSNADGGTSTAGLTTCNNIVTAFTALSTKEAACETGGSGITGPSLSQCETGVTACDAADLTVIGSVLSCFNALGTCTTSTVQTWSASLQTCTALFSGTDAGGGVTAACQAALSGGGNQNADAGVTLVNDGGQPPPGDAGSGQVCNGNSNACSSVAQAGSAVNVVQVASAAPVAAGGAIMPGTYVLTADTVYTGAGGATGQTGYPQEQTIQVTSSGSGLVVNSVSTSEGCTNSLTLDVVAASPALAVTQTCPACTGGSNNCVTGASLTYDATTTGLTIYVQSGPSVQAEVFTLQTQ